MSPTPAPRASATGTWASNPGSYVVDEAGRIAAARQPAGLEAVIAEVLDATDPDPRRGVRHGPSGQDRDAEALRSVAPTGRPGAAGSGGRAVRWPPPTDRRSRARASRRSPTRSGRGRPSPSSAVESRADVAASRPPRTGGSRRDGDARQDRLQPASHDVRPDAAERAVADDPVGVDPEVDGQGERVPGLRRPRPSLSRPIGRVDPSDSANAATVPSSSLTSTAMTTRPSAA